MRQRQQIVRGAFVNASARDLAVSARTHATLPLFWRIAEAFRRAPSGWDLTYLRFELRRSFEIEGARWMMSARLGSGTPKGQTRLTSAPYVHLWAPPGSRADERRLARHGVYDRLAAIFREAGFTFGWDRPFEEKLAWAWRRNAGVGFPGFHREREWLEQVFAPPRHFAQRARTAPRSPESLWDILDWYRRHRAGPWTPVVAEYRKTCSLVLDGRRVGTPTLNVKVTRWDQDRRTARREIRAEAGVAFFTEQLQPRDRLRLRQRGWFREIERELERLGYRGEWSFRYPRVQPLGSFGRWPLTSVPDVLRERRRLEAFARRWFSVP